MNSDTGSYASVRKSTQKRDVILAAARSVFLDVGYKAASINEIVRLAGGSKSTLYGYFPTKEALFEAVVISTMSELETISHLPDNQNLDMREGLMLFARNLLKLVTSDKNIDLARIVIAEAKRAPELGEIFYRRGPVRASRWLTGFMAGQRAKGIEIKGDDREAADWFMSKLLHRWIFERLCVNGPVPDAYEIEYDVRMAVDGFMECHVCGSAGERM
ncbi:TetR family transcriptional regulator [Iodidimonas gelatinilytica]|uniref:TetR family transcriptional regulator n=1 Tax=Iodidimonas gelatinilytica TaxID=1236966 RepID=A0A5A7N0J6_9PROT|nr:TetR/AcrR family transcriptional regulator [Iodidimonas gelatinilytica]GEQ98101.1 TetR family transcriptional regulator [Iodidimonas gelatinilytica]GER00719.1 TetR family transcriptional regulator [Iodidimonas gelatinilytica]